VEPPLFYVKNLALNLNLAYPLAVLALPLATVAGKLWPQGKMRENGSEIEQTGKKLENPMKMGHKRRTHSSSPKRKAVIAKEEKGFLIRLNFEQPKT
jgi:hypothetical protein